MNPASRLLEFVSKAKSLPGNIPAIEGWVNVLELEKGNYIEVYTGIADIIQLTHDARKAINCLNGYDNDKGLFLGPLNNVLSGIDIVNMQAPWEHLTSKFDSQTILGLQFCSAVLDQHLKEASLSDDEMRAWLQEIEDLLISITTSEVPDQLKIFFVEHLEKLRSALLHYWIFGTVGVQVSVEKTFGALLVRRSQLSAIKDDSFFKRFFDLFTNVANAITVFEGAQSLKGSILSLLSGAS
jgi:hypothetical protein